MGYLIFVLTLLFLVISALFFTKYKEYISRKNKIILGISLLMLAGLIGLYNILQEQESENLNVLKSAFMRNIEINCTYQGHIISVTPKNFNLSNGTMSFQGKTDTSFSHVIIPLQDCTLQENAKAIQ